MGKRVAVLIGGYSSEAEISHLSGEAVLAHIDREKFSPMAVHIGRESWSAQDADGTYAIEKGDFSYYKGGEKCSFDMAFIAVHGSPGEDGRLQAYLDLIGLPYTGCSMAQAVLTSNKYACNQLLHSFGIPISRSLLLNTCSDYAIDELIAYLKLPLFVKPNKGGSSFGTAKVRERAALPEAIQRAFAEDDEVLLEAALTGREVSVGVLQYGGDTLVLPLTELVYKDFFDYEAKYEGQSQEITPARLDEAQAEELVSLTRRFYRHLNIKGFSRTDYILSDGVPYLLEVNTVPGLTQESIFPQQLRAAGLSLGAFITAELERITG